MSPLSRRLPREARHNLGRYLGMFLLLVMAVSFTAGFLVSAASIKDIADGMRETYHIEDCFFVTMYEAPDDAIAAVEGLGARVYKNFSRDVPLATPDTDRDDMTVRIYPNRTGEFDGVAYAEGRAPAATGEIALDRVFCANHNLALGNTVQVAGEDFELVGIVTLSDYQATYKNAGDFMFNASSFTVAQLADKDFERLAGEGSTYRYSVLFDDRTLDLAARIELEKDLVDAVNDHDATIIDLVDRESNIGLTFAADDVEGDMRMWEILLYLLIVIMAFVFVVLTDATIEREAPVIGTLLASGYRKREIIRHYLVLPTLIGLLGCGLGLLLGYTLMAAPMQGLYYNSYSFPPFSYTFHPEVLALTSVVPFVLLVAITWLGLVRKLRATPLMFLRGEISRKVRRGGARLSEKLPFVVRFRLRVLLRNLSSFVTLFCGVLFGSLLLLMGLGLLPIVSVNADLMAESVPAEHLYTTKAELKLDGTQAERDAWAAAFELTTNPAYDAIDLSLLGDLSDQLEAVGVKLDKLSGNGDKTAADKAAAPEDKAAATKATAKKATADKTATDLSSLKLPQEIEDMIEDSVKNRRWKPSDPAVLALWRRVAELAGVELSCTDAELAKIVRTADRFHCQLHQLSNKDLKAAYALVEDLVDAAQDSSVDLSDMDTPVNQTAIDEATLAQVERFAVAQVEVPRRMSESVEKVTVYGIEPNSRYWDYADVSDGRVLAGKGFLEKCAIDLGRAVAVTDRSTNTDYDIVVDDVCGNGTDVNLYMRIDAFNELFGKDEGHFNGYASDAALPLDERYVASELTPDKMRSMSDQMQDSMGSIMRLIVALVIPIYLVLIYLLTKTVIDRSARAISSMKVFGYRDREVNGLYIRAITVVVVTSIVVCVPILLELFSLVVRVMMARYAGNFIISVAPEILLQEIGIGIVTYLAVAALHVRAIRRVPLALAMKVME